MTEIPLWLTVHTIVTGALAGLIWVVRVVIYPSFSLVRSEAFRDYHAAHCRRITWVVAPLMLAEVATAGWLLWLGFVDPIFVGSLVLLAINWLSTWMLQVPLHERLSLGFDTSAHQSLMRSNRWRTAAWTLRAIALVAILKQPPA